MTTEAGSFEEYVGSLQRLTALTDPTIPTPESAAIKTAAEAIDDLAEVTLESLAAYVAEDSTRVPVLGLAVGLSQEKLKNALREHLGTMGWVTIGRDNPASVVEMLDREFDLVRLVEEQRNQAYSFGDVLVARAGTRVTAVGAATAGRLVEEAIEAVATELGLPVATRTRFEGRDHRTAPCDLAIPGDAAGALIVVAAKGFDSTGSKLTDAVREVEEMAEVRLPTQFVMAAIDGIGWLSRQSDLRKIFALNEAKRIDGMYTLATLDTFKTDLESAARRHGLL